MVNLQAAVQAADRIETTIQDILDGPEATSNPAGPANTCRNASDTVIGQLTRIENSVNEISNRVGGIL